MVASLLAACSSGKHPHQASATGPAPQKTVAALGSLSLAAPSTFTHATIQAVKPSPDQLQELRPYLSTGVVVGAPVSIETTEPLPASGVVLTRRFAVPLPSGATATFAYLDPQLGTWVATPSEVSPDRRSVIATVHHLSTWTELVGGTQQAVSSFVDGARKAGSAIVDAAQSATSSATQWAADAFTKGADALYYAVGKVFTTRVDAPSCAKGLPYWADDVITIAAGHNDPILFCAGHDQKNPALLVIKARVNRGFGFPLSLAAKPAWQYDSSYDTGSVSAMLDVVTEPDTTMAANVAEVLSGGEVVGAGKEFSVGLTAEQAAAVKAGAPVVELKVPSVITFLTSLLAQMLVEQGMPDRRQLGVGHDRDGELRAPAQRYVRCAERSEGGGELLHRRGRGHRQGHRPSAGPPSRPHPHVHRGGRREGGGPSHGDPGADRAHRRQPRLRGGQRDGP
jgi:hypothetical protein